MDCSMSGFPVAHYLLEFAQIHAHESVMFSDHLILCRPLLLLPSIFSSIRIFSNESVLCIRWPKYWSFRFSISPSNEYSGLIFFRMDWLDLLAVQGTLKSLHQHHSSKASILRRSPSMGFSRQEYWSGKSKYLKRTSQLGGGVHCLQRDRSSAPSDHLVEISPNLVLIHRLWPPDD